MNSTLTTFVQVLLVLNSLTINASDVVQYTEKNIKKKRHLLFIILYQFCTYCEVFGVGVNILF